MTTRGWPLEFLQTKELWQLTVSIEVVEILIPLLVGFHLHGRTLLRCVPCVLRHTGIYYQGHAWKRVERAPNLLHCKLFRCARREQLVHGNHDGVLLSKIIKLLKSRYVFLRANGSVPDILEFPITDVACLDRDVHVKVLHLLLHGLHVLDVSVTSRHVALLQIIFVCG